MTRLTATEVARSFSVVLNRVAAGEEFEVTRAGAPVATITASRPKLLSAERFRELIATAPAPDREFAVELRALRDAVPAPEQAWPS